MCVCRRWRKGDDDDDGGGGGSDGGGSDGGGSDGDGSGGWRNSYYTVRTVRMYAAVVQ